MYCRNCGSKISDKAEYCISCGCRPLDGNQFCQACGARTNPNQEICVKCGVRLRIVHKNNTTKNINKGLYIIFTCLGVFGILMILGNVILPFFSDLPHDGENILNIFEGIILLIISFVVRKITRKNFKAR